MSDAPPFGDHGCGLERGAHCWHTDGHAFRRRSELARAEVQASCCHCSRKALFMPNDDLDANGHGPFLPVLKLVPKDWERTA